MVRPSPRTQLESILGNPPYTRTTQFPLWLLSPLLYRSQDPLNRFQVNFTEVLYHTLSRRTVFSSLTTFGITISHLTTGAFSYPLGHSMKIIPCLKTHRPVFLPPFKADPSPLTESTDRPFASLSRRTLARRLTAGHPPILEGTLSPPTSDTSQDPPILCLTVSSTSVSSIAQWVDVIYSRFMTVFNPRSTLQPTRSLTHLVTC